MVKWLPFLALGLIPPGCQTKPLPPPADVVSAPALGLAQSDKDSKISAYAEAAEKANQSNPEGPAKDATQGSISVIRSYAGPSAEKDRKDAFSLIDMALGKDLVKAEQGWSKAKAQAEIDRAEIERLRKQVESEKIQAAAEWQKRLDKANSDADKERKRWIMAIFFGLGAIGLVGGVVMLVLLANPTTAASYAFLGPKAGFCAIGAGLTLIATGIAVNAIEKLIDAHPWGFGAMVAAALALTGISATLVYANHREHVTK